MPLKHRPRSTFTERPLRVLVLLNSPAHDWLGQELLTALKKQQPRAVFFGMGGAGMRHLGLNPLPTLPLEVNFQALRGIHKGNVLRNLYYNKRLLATQCGEKNIDVVITIGPAPLFAPLVKNLCRRYGVPCYHYGQTHQPVFPPAASLKPYSHIFCFYPAEAEDIREKGLDATFVGHPILAHFAAYIPTGESKPLSSPRKIALMPGQRGAVVKQVMPAMASMAQNIKENHPQGCDVVLPLAGTTNPRHFEAYSTLQATYARGEEKHKALSACDAALALAGEDNLHLALFGVPMVVVRPPGIAQRLSALRSRPNRGFTSPVNSLLGEQAVPEVSCGDGEAIAAQIQPLLENTPQRRQQLAAFHKVRRALRPPDGQSVPDKAAEILLSSLLSKI